MASVPTEPIEPWDALVVLNQRTTPAALTRIGAGWRHVHVLSSHLPFPPEHAAITAALAPARVTFSTFPDLLDDAALAGIDEATTAELQAAGTAAEVQVVTFQQRMLERRNAAAHGRLPAGRPGAAIFAARGLGIAWSYWASQGARSLTPISLRERLAQSAVRRAISVWRARRRTPALGFRLAGADGTYLFAASLRRLPLVPASAVVEVPLNRQTAARADWVATTLHDHPLSVASLGRPVRVFSDGYLPSNYSRSYLDSYGAVEFVACDPFAARWFRRCGVPVARPPRFIEARPFAAPALPTREFSTVVILGGHGGDWSALIDRSDNDRLVELAAALAHAFPRLRFRLRLHPTMDDPRHDGAGARDRVATFIRSCSRPNLELSARAWASDLAEGDAFVSEYSATLIDAWRAGRPGLIANLTGRRSFMQDFADLGFSEVTGATAANAWVAEMAADPVRLRARQEEAAQRYNALLSEHFAP